MTKATLGVVQKLQDDLEGLKNRKRKLEHQVRRDGSQDEKEKLQEMKRDIQYVRSEIEGYRNGQIYRSIVLRY